MAYENVIKLIAIMLKVVPELETHIPDQPANLTSFLSQKLNWYYNLLTEDIDS